MPACPLSHTPPLPPGTALLWLPLILLSCEGEASPAWRERYEWLVLTNQGGVIDATFQVGNTGLERGEGVLELRRSQPGAEGSALRGVIPSGALERSPDGRRIGQGNEGLLLREGVWGLRHGEAESNALLQLKVDPLVRAIEGGDTRWRMTVPVPVGEATGWIEDHGQGGPIEGRGVLLHHGGTALWPGPRLGVFLLDDTLCLGLDRQGDRQTAWAFRDGEPLDAADARVEEDGEGLLLTFPSARIEARITLRPARVVSNASLRLSPPERWLIGGEGAWERELRAAQAMVSQGAGTQRVPALVLRVGELD